MTGVQECSSTDPRAQGSSTGRRRTSILRSGCRSLAVCAPAFL